MLEVRTALALYSPLKDLIKMLTGRDKAPSVRAEAVALGPKTRIVVTATSNSKQSLVVRTCRAELYATAYDACSGPQPQSTRSVTFLPSGRVTLSPGEPPATWEAQVLNHTVRMACREADRQLTEEAYLSSAAETWAGREAREAKVHAVRAGRAEVGGEVSASFLRRLWAELEAPRGVRVRAVLELADGRSVASNDVLISPPAPLHRRLLDLRRRVAAGEQTESAVAAGAASQLNSGPPS